MNIIKKKIVRAEPDVKSIGVIGIGRAVGTTHTAISIASYLHCIGCKRTAIYEWNDHEDLAKVKKTCRVKNIGSGGYRLHGIDIYGGAGLGGYLEIAALDYDYIVIDFGELREGSRADISRCYKCIYLLSLEAWKIGASMDAVEMDDMRGDKRRKYLTVFASEDSVRRIRRRYHIDLQSIPFSADAWIISSETSKCWNTILQEYSVSRPTF